MVGITTLNQDTFDVINALLVANKPTYTDPQGETQTYTVLSSYNQDKVVLPCIVIDPSEPVFNFITIDGSYGEIPISVQLNFYARAKHGNKAVDAGVDSVRSTFLDNITSLQDDNLLLMQNPFDESNVVPFEDANNQQVLTKSMIIKMKIQ